MTVSKMLQIPDPPEGETWKYARVGQAVADTPEGKVLIKRMEDQGITVEILQGGGYDMMTMPQVPPDAKVRSLFKEQEKT